MAKEAHNIGLLLVDK